jgi:hypothetical protein
MDEAVVRIALVGGALVVALVVSLAIRRGNRGKPEVIDNPGLAGGVYLFTSSACQGCTSARRAVTDAFGAEGFIEVNWEAMPGEFARLGISAVPATLVVAEDGSGVLYPGQPGDAFKGLESLNGT